MDIVFLVTTIALMNILLFMVGWKLGSLKQVEHQDKAIDATGFFTLNNQVYRAIKLGIDPKARPAVETLPEIVELPTAPIQVMTTSETVFDDDDDDETDMILINEPPPAKKPIRRRRVVHN